MYISVSIISSEVSDHHTRQVQLEANNNMHPFDWQESAQTQTPADGSRSQRSTAAAKPREVESELSRDRPRPQQLANLLPRHLQADVSVTDEAAVGMLSPAAEQLMSLDEPQRDEAALGKTPPSEAARKVPASAPEMTNDEIVQRNLEAAAEANSIPDSLGDGSDIQCGQPPPPPSFPSELHQVRQLLDSTS